MGTKRPNAKLKKWMVRMIRQSKQTNRELASLIGVSRETIGLCRRRVTWSDVK